MAKSRWGEWDPEVQSCPECGDGDNVPGGYYLCGTCDAEWEGEDDEETQHAPTA